MAFLFSVQTKVNVLNLGVAIAEVENIDEDKHWNEINLLVAAAAVVPVGLAEVVADQQL